MRYLLLAVLSATLSPGHAQTFSSGPARTHLLELYTSEGCSSCPPAERWLSQRKEDAGLWRDFVPVAFHVDYWDNLGWPDRFASAAFTRRQRAYATEWRSDSVYTPEFVLDGQEWHPGGSPSADGQAGSLRATVAGAKVEVSYEPMDEAAGPWEVHAAALSMNEKIAVRGGENGGRDLVHDFVASGIVSAPLGEGGRAMLELPEGKRFALAVWVTKAGALAPQQAAGGWLK